MRDINVRHHWSTSNSAAVVDEQKTRNVIRDTMILKLMKTIIRLKNVYGDRKEIDKWHLHKPLNRIKICHFQSFSK